MCIQREYETDVLIIISKQMLQHNGVLPINKSTKQDLIPMNVRK